MVHKKMLAIIALLAAISLLFAACGSKKDAETEAPGSSQSGAEVLELADWNLSATTWSSPNGATIHLTATPAGYVKGQSALFTVRLEGEEVDSADCEWDGTHYTASLDLNGEDGYCYYVKLTGSTGETVEIPVNTPSAPTNEAFINLAASLESSCSVLVESSSFDGKWLTITGGTVAVQPPRVTNEGESVTCSKAVLTLYLDGEEAGQVALDVPAAAEDGSYVLNLTDTSFQTPEMEDDQQLSIQLDVTLSNGQTLSAPGSTWFYNAGDLMMSVG